jgi:hypothetical protein
VIPELDLYGGFSVISCPPLCHSINGVSFTVPRASRAPFLTSINSITLSEFCNKIRRKRFRQHIHRTQAAQGNIPGAPTFKSRYLYAKNDGSQQRQAESGMSKRILFCRITKTVIYHCFILSTGK